jgi:tetratricopeptide (TPR) repeat protein
MIGSTMLYFARRTSEAILQLRKTVDLEPNFWFSRVFLAMSYEQAHDYRHALAEAQKARELENAPFAVKTLGHIQAMMGNLAETHRILGELIKMSGERYVPPTGIAALYAVLGDKESAFQWLEKANRDKDEWLLCLPTDPYMDPLRGDPRLDDLIRRLNL